ncbi:hypothetical protein CR513_20868, partial [Mucuna pruriens]
MVNEVSSIDNPRLENQLTELTLLVRQLAIGQHQPIVVVKACGICTSVEHPTDICPTLQETEPDHPKSVGSLGSTIWMTTIPVESKSRAVCSSWIQLNLEHALKPRQLSIAKSKLLGAIVPTIAIAENATTRFDGRSRFVALSSRVELPNLASQLPSRVGRSSQRPKSCRHTWCRVEIKSASQIRTQ